MGFLFIFCRSVIPMICITDSSSILFLNCFYSGNPYKVSVLIQTVTTVKIQMKCHRSSLRYVQWTIPSLFDQTRRKNSFVYKMLIRVENSVD